MRSPQRYKTRYGLYRATIRVMDELTTVKKAWWIHQALYHCQHNFPDLESQLRDLIGRPLTLEDLSKINEINN